MEQWSPEHETDVAIRYLEGAAGRKEPFALFVSWNPPHSPYHYVPEKYRQLYKDLQFPVRGNVDAARLHYHTPEASKMTEEDLREATRDYFAAVSGLDEQFGRLLRRVESTLAGLADRLAAGDIEAEPLRTGPGRSVCDFCDYRAACHFDEDSRRDAFRTLTGLRDSEVHAILEEEEKHAHPLH